MKHHYTHHHTHPTKHHKKVKKKRGKMENYHQTNETGTRKKRGLLIALIVLGLLVVLVAVILILEKEKVEPNPIDVQCKFACENAQRTAFCFVERKVNDELTTQPHVMSFQKIPYMLNIMLRHVLQYLV